MTDPLMMSTCCPLDSGEVVPVMRCAGRWLCEVQPRTAVADTVIDFIRRRFQLAYGAQPSLRIPALLALTTAQGSLLAAVGVRDASRERLFLEDYLDEPAETLIPGRGVPERGQIAEIAHLAGVEAGTSRYLFPALTLWLRDKGYRWVMFTGTDQLRNSFGRLGIETHVLAPADPARLADGGEGWGQYYDHHPQVMAVSVDASHQALTASGLLRRVNWLDNSAAEEGRYGFTA
ncbi:MULTISPECIES: thermostable hemolysin [Marinobacter]|nr:MULTISPECIES: thermostable hemolysin [Marinobacter]MBD3657615.1 thermostable hemolysin [Marinobacter sp.]